jgi:mannose-6-phosphate isomerase-like protein (cupin superfamily)
MRRFANGCQVTLAAEAEIIGAEQREGCRRFRRPISRAHGAREIAQTVSVYRGGCAPARINPRGDEVHYVVSGEGFCWIDGGRHELKTGTAFYIPAGAAYAIENTRADELKIVAVSCPEDDGSRIADPESIAVRGQALAPPRRLTMHESEARAIPTGDREFKLLIDQSFGCALVTQFIGFIPPSRAPQHHHPYEEAIYILEGKGIIRAGAEACEFAPGTSIYLPIGTKHCLENPFPEPVRLLGVFYPSGSPAVNYRD